MFKALLVVCVPAVVIGFGAFLYLDYVNWDPEFKFVQPPKPTAAAAKKQGGCCGSDGGCCCAAKGKACNCGSAKTTAAKPVGPASAVRAVGLLGSPLGQGPLTATPTLLGVEPSPNK